MSAEEERLLRLAEAVADEAPIDWARESLDSDSLPGKVDNLRLIDSIAAACRAIVREAEVAPSAGAPESSPSTGESRAVVEEDPPPEVWGRLRLIGEISRGKFCRVFRAHDPVLQKDVALKLPRTNGEHRSELDRFLNEARRLARVRHANVVTVHGADRHGGQIGIWTDLIEGDTLEECLWKRGPYGAEEAALTGIDLCRALAAVHAEGLIHRDVKTTNVMREKGGRTVLLDFNAVSERVARDQTGSAEAPVGTPQFMAPELFQGGEASSASDVYSLGVVLYRLVSNRYPVQAADLPDLIERHRRGEFQPLRDVRPDLPGGFVEAVERALAPNPDKRIRTAGEMERALRATIGAPHPAAPGARPWWQRGSTYAWLSVGVVAVTVLGFGLAALLNPPPLRIETSLHRIQDGAEERLRPGAEVRPGDRLLLQLRGSHPMHVYVVNEDERGSTFALFPLRSIGPQNPLAPGRDHRLPGGTATAEHYWQVSDVGGRETFYVIASKEPLPELERDLASLPQAGSGAAVTRGVGGVSTSETPEAEDFTRRKLARVMRHLSSQDVKDGRVVVWEIELSNPGGP